MPAFPGEISTTSEYTLLSYDREVTLGLTGHQRPLSIIRYSNQM